MILRFISKQKLYEELLRREGFDEGDNVEMSATLREVFHKVPNFRHLLKKREILLLKSLTLDDRNQQFTKGQIAENRLFQTFDVPMPAMPKVDTGQTNVQKVEKEGFLSKWKNADNRKKNDVEEDSQKDQGEGLS